MKEYDYRLPHRPEDETKPAKIPHLHVRTVEGLLFEEAIAITGNARALLQLRDQIDRALRNETSHPFDHRPRRSTYATIPDPRYRRVLGVVSAQRTAPRDRTSLIPSPASTPTGSC
jgi:hypothetical protein